MSPVTSNFYTKANNCRRTSIYERIETISRGATQRDLTANASYRERTRATNQTLHKPSVDIDSVYGRVVCSDSFESLSGTDLSVTDSEGLTLFHYALIKDDLPTLRKLISWGLNANTADKQGLSPLHYAVIRENEESVKALIEAGVNIDSVDKEGISPLFYGVICNNSEIIQTLLNNGANVDQLDKTNRSPLHEAVSCNYIEVAKTLIQAGSKVDLGAEERGYTPLHMAKSFDMFKLLLDNKAPVDARDENGVTPLSSYVDRNAYKTDGDPKEACRVIDLLLQHGADINSQNNFGDTPLTYAITSVGDSFVIIKHLLEKGANINLPDNRERTPLRKAVFAGQYRQRDVVQSKDLCSLLLDEGANMETPDYLGKTPLHYCVEVLSWPDNLDYTIDKTETRKVLGLLIEKGANINATDKEGKTPLHYAIRSYNLDLVKQLINHGANPNIKDNSGDKPSQYALSYPSSPPPQKALEISSYLREQESHV